MIMIIVKYYMLLVSGYATALLFYENSDHLIFIVIFCPSYTKNEYMATSPFHLLEGSYNL